MRDADRPNPADGFWPGAHRRRRRHDADRSAGRHHGIHVAGAGAGQGSGPALRPVHAGIDPLRIADRQDAVRGRERRRQLDQAHPGTSHPGVGSRRDDSAAAQQHREQVPGARSQIALPDCGRVAARSGRVFGQRRGGEPAFSTGGRALGTHHSLAAGDRHRHRAGAGDRGLCVPRAAVLAVGARKPPRRRRCRWP